VTVLHFISGVIFYVMILMLLSTEVDRGSWRDVMASYSGLDEW